MDNIVKNFVDIDVLNVVPQSVKVLVHSFLVAWIMVGVYVYV